MTPTNLEMVLYAGLIALISMPILALALVAMTWGYLAALKRGADQASTIRSLERRLLDLEHLRGVERACTDAAQSMSFEEREKWLRGEWGEDGMGSPPPPQPSKAYREFRDGGARSFDGGVPMIFRTGPDAFFGEPKTGIPPKQGSSAKRPPHGGYPDGA